MKDVATYKQELIKRLFRHSIDDTLERFMRSAARKLTRLAIVKGEVADNVLQGQSVFETIAYIRDLAARALPDGRLLVVPRSEFEKIYGPQTWARHDFVK